MKSLCESCANVKLIFNKRGSKFLLCTFSKKDLSYAKYPRQPVVDCKAFHLDKSKEKEQ